MTKWIAVLNALIWGALSTLGVSAVGSVTQQHAAGFPNSDQLKYYVTMPAVMTVIAAAMLGWLLLSRPSGHPVTKRAAQALLALSLISVPLYLFFYTGGV